MATSDLHMHVHPHDYYADSPRNDIGLARVARLIRSLRADASNCLLFDNGDFLQGSPLGDYIAEVRGVSAGGVHPMIAAMNTLRYDAGTLGNHEFNHGLDFLRTSLAGAEFPLVCANALTNRGPTPLQDDTLLPPYVLLDRHLSCGNGETRPIRIGVIGVLPPQILAWDATHLRGRLETRDIVEAVAAFLPRMDAAGAELVIVLCHSGIGPAEPQPGMENAATALARMAGIDVLVLGHSHLVFPSADFAGRAEADLDRGTLCGKPAVMPGRFGSHLGLIDLVLDRDPAGWRIAHARVQPIAVDTLPEGADEAALAAVQEAHEQTLAHIRQPVGRSTVALNSYFSVLPGNAALSLVAEAQRWHVAQALRDTPHAALPLLSAVSPFKMGGRGGSGFYTDVPAGELALRHVADLYVYPNTIRAMLVTGAELTAWLERSAGMFLRLAPGLADQPLLDLAKPPTEFDVIHGVTWAVDLAAPGKPGGGRICELAHAGRPVRPDDRFIVATNSYRADGGSAFPGASDRHIVLDQTVTNRDILLRYIARQGTVSPDPAPCWRFLPMPGTTALFDSAPGAAAHLPALRDIRVEPAGDGPVGFARFRLHL